MNQLDQNGCIIYERDNDLKEKISKEDVTSFHSAGAKLKEDMNEILNYFTGEEKKKCRKFKNGTVKKIDAVCNYIDSYGFHIIILFCFCLKHLRTASQTSKKRHTWTRLLPGFVKILHENRLKASRMFPSSNWILHSQVSTVSKVVSVQLANRLFLMGSSMVKRIDLSILLLW